MSALRKVKMAKVTDLLAAKEALIRMNAEVEKHVLMGAAARTGYGNGEVCDMRLSKSAFNGMADVGWKKDVGELTYEMLYDSDDTRKLNSIFGGNFEMSFQQYYTCAVAAKELQSRGYAIEWAKQSTGEVRVQATAW
jgi:hypothetical protein